MATQQEIQDNRKNFPKIVFSATNFKGKYYKQDINDSLFDNENPGNFVIWVNAPGVYIPEYDQPKPISKAIGRTFTPLHSIDHARFTVNLVDQREEVYWMLKELEAYAYSDKTYTPIGCVDYVLPDFEDRVAGYTIRVASQFTVRSEGLFLSAYTSPKHGGEWIEERFFHKTSFTFEIERNTQI